MTDRPGPGRTAGAPAVAIFAPAPVLVATLEYPDDGSDAEVAINVGGQGPWVARAVQALGARAVLVAPFGGDTGRVARRLLAEEPHEVRAVDTKAAIAFYVEERRHGARSCLRDVPPGRFGQREIDDLYSATLAAAIESGVCVITGSPWAGHVDASLVRRLTTDLATLGVLTVADVSGDQLDAALEGGVDWLKVARSDLERGGDRPGGEPSAGAAGSEAWLWQWARELAAAGGRRRRVVVSRGSAPALVVAGEDAYVVTTPELSTVDSRGSGAVRAGGRRPGGRLRRSAPGG